MYGDDRNDRKVRESVNYETRHEQVRDDRKLPFFEKIVFAKVSFL